MAGTANENESNVITVRSRAARRNVLWLVKPVWGDRSVVWWTQRTESGPLDWLVSELGFLVFALRLHSLQFLASFAWLWKLLRCWTSEKSMNKLIAQAVIFILFCCFFSCLYRLPASGSNSIRLHPLQTYPPTLRRLQQLQLSHRHAFIYRNRVQISPDLPSPIIPDLLTPPGLGRSSCYLTAHACGGGALE